MWGCKKEELGSIVFIHAGWFKALQNEVNRVFDEQERDRLYQEIKEKADILIKRHKDICSNREFIKQITKYTYTTFLIVCSMPCKIQINAAIYLASYFS